MKFSTSIRLLTSFFCFIMLFGGGMVVAQENSITLPADTSTSLSTTQESASSRVAPGEFLPFSIKLVNFGSSKRIDVTVTYKIFDANGNEVSSENETVAVETTASFVKRIELPSTLKEGIYTAVSSLQYPDQKQPAVSKFTFSVESKIGGIFKSDFIFYSVLIIFAVLALVFIIRFLVIPVRSRRVVLHDYSDKPKSEIIYYEMLSDIVAQMRLRIGDEALEMAKNIPDLTLDERSGRIVNIKKEPAKIIALLITRYEKLTGSKISFGLRHS